MFLHASEHSVVIKHGVPVGNIQVAVPAEWPDQILANGATARPAEVNGMGPYSSPVYRGTITGPHM
jgi:hypothetical protein